MSNIPTKKDQANNNANAAAQQAAATRAAQVKRLTDALVAAINANTQKSVVIQGGFPDDVVSEVAREFAKSGWTLVRTGQSRSSASFSLT